MSLGATYSPTVPMGEAASYKPWPVFTHSKGYWIVYIHFQWDFLVEWGGGGLSIDEFVMEKNFHEGGAGFFSIF